MLGTMAGIAVAACGFAVEWQHPAGMTTAETLVEIREKVSAEAWARAARGDRVESLEPWVSMTDERLREVFPTVRGNVYHNFSCPKDRVRLAFDPSEPKTFHCPVCGAEFAPDVDPGVYSPDDIYHGTLYDGWACLFYQSGAAAAADLALLGKLDRNPAYVNRAVGLLMLFAKTIAGLPSVPGKPGDDARILTYKREGDNKVLCDLALAYEWVRDIMTEEQRARFEHDVLERMLDDIMLEPIYAFDHNNIYQYHRTILQVAAALERDDLVDWCFGEGGYSPEFLPEHRSIRRIAETHFKPDGAFWELCSGYHLYPMYHFCELAVLSRNLSHMDPVRFPPDQYDLTCPDNPGSQVIKRALEWFFSMAMPDRTMPVVGDSPVPRSGMDSYAMTAEVGYRLFNLFEVADYKVYREGKRSWLGLLYGARRIESRELPFESANLASGWVSLRSEANGNRVWAGLNALERGGGHQHADRLTLTTFSQGELLLLEKGTPYNESVTRELGALTPAHNTVTIDAKSQPQGETLTDNQRPVVDFFTTGSFLQYARVRDEALYPQAKTYRRWVAIIEDVMLDCFEVAGGQTRDWIVHHAGSAPELSMACSPAPFEPADWLYNGTDNVRHASVFGDWTATWRVNDVTSRMTMFGEANTDVYALETYPIDNAVVTEDHPPCQTLCVRRHDNTPFFAVWDAWKEDPNLVTATRFHDRLMIQTRSNVYYCLTAPGEAVFGDGVTLSSDGVFAVLRNRDAIAYVGATYAEAKTPQGGMRIGTSRPANAWLCWNGVQGEGDRQDPVVYDTFGNENKRRESSSIDITISGDLHFAPANKPVVPAAPGNGAASPSASGV